MAHRSFRYATVVSAILLCINLLLAMVGAFTDPRDLFVSISDSFHVSIMNMGTDSRIVFFNDSDYGPYRGSIISVTDGSQPRTVAIGDTWGLYYRHFEWPTQRLWTIMISVWYPILFSAMVLVASLLRRTTFNKDANPK
jgi:hypothetical protein